MASIRQALLVGIAYFRVAACLAVEQPCVPTSAPPLTLTMTTTIPWTGSTTSSTTFTPCSGPVTVIVETPLAVTCPSLRSSQTKATTISTSSSTSIIGTTISRKTSHPPATAVTTTVPGTTSGTTTITPSQGCTRPCTTSVIVTTTTVATSACAVQPTCGPSGLNVDYYANKFGYNGYTSPIAGGTRKVTLPPSYYLTERLAPLQSSFTNITFFAQQRVPGPVGSPKVFPDPQNPAVPYFVGYTRETNGGIVVDGNNFTLVYEGFYRAPMSGVYTFCASVDNVNSLYIGAGQALDCHGGIPLANATALLSSTAGANFINPVSCADIFLVQGQFYPIRNVMGNGDNVSAFDLTVKKPGGTPSHNNTGLLYPIRCARSL